MSVIVSLKTDGYIPEVLDPGFIIGKSLNEEIDHITYACKKEDCEYVAKKILVDDEASPDGCYTDKDYVKNEILISQMVGNLGIAPRVYAASLNSKEAMMILDKYDGDMNDLIQLYKTDKSIPMDAILETIQKLIEILHNNGIVHRDLHPGNIFYTKEGIIAIADYGQSVISDSEELREGDRNEYKSMAYIVNQLKQGRDFDKGTGLTDPLFIAHSELDIQRPPKILISFNGKICPDIW